MKLIADLNRSKRFVIEHDETVGYYLYVFEDGRCVRDYLQNSLDGAINFAFAQFNVPKKLWAKAD